MPPVLLIDPTVKANRAARKTSKQTWISVQLGPITETFFQQTGLEFRSIRIPSQSRAENTIPFSPETINRPAFDVSGQKLGGDCGITRCPTG